MKIEYWVTKESHRSAPTLECGAGPSIRLVDELGEPVPSTLLWTGCHSRKAECLCTAVAPRVTTSHRWDLTMTRTSEKTQ